MLANVAEDLADEFPQRFAVSVEGAPRRVEPMVLEELGRIAEEAVRNAFRHAKALRVEVSITHARRDLRLSVQDNGAGFSDTVAELTRRDGHFGLTGMHERAERAGGKLFISSRAGAGTEVFVTIPAKRAYVASPAGGRLLRALAFRPHAAGL
jgi:signal transduction histidine kinase